MSAKKGLFLLIAVAVSLSFCVFQVDAGECLPILEKGLAKSKKMSDEYKELTKVVKGLILKKNKSEKDKKKKDKLKKKRLKLGVKLKKHSDKTDTKLKKCIDKKLYDADRGDKFKKGWNHKKFEKALKEAFKDAEKLEAEFNKCNRSKKDKQDCQRILVFWQKAEKRKYQVLDMAVK